MWAGSSDVEFRDRIRKNHPDYGDKISVPTAKPGHGTPARLNPPSMDAAYQDAAYQKDG